MELYSLAFLFLLAAGLTGFYVWGSRSRNPNIQWGILLVMSMLFYLSQGWKQLLFILTTSLAVFFGTLVISRIEERPIEKTLPREEKKKLKAEKKKQKSRIMLLVLVFCLLVLAYVKYLNVFLRSISQFAGASFRPLKILFPLGISFYTFQSLSYLLDIYNGKYKPEKNYLKFLLFVSWFPQLLQGPINRFDSLSKDLFRRHTFSYERFRAALLLTLYGMLKKYALADMLVDFNSALLSAVTAQTPGAVTLVSMVVYTVWQYADFSGGIDMVMGISNLFDVDMMPNFRQPFFAQSLAEFWRRWHISLGAWMRDYVFYPVAVSKPVLALSKKCSKSISIYAGRIAPAVVSNIVVFLLVGLWHGATANYLLWGLYNGVVISLGEITRPWSDRLHSKLRLPERLSACFHIGVTVLLVMVGNVLECREQVSVSILSLVRILSSFRLRAAIAFLSPIFRQNITLTSVLLIGFAFSAVVLADICEERRRPLSGWIAKQHTIVRWMIYLCMLTAVLLSFTRITSGGGFAYANF